MKMSFSVLSSGESYIDQYVNDNGSVVTQKEKGDITERMVEFAGAAISESAEVEKQRTLYMAAVFFQRVVNRTPVDEDYWYLDKKTDDMKFHRADDDYVREAWSIKGPAFSFTAKDFMNDGVEFDEFNNKSDIDKIYKILRDTAESKSFGKSFYIIIDNFHERFSQLEFGEYLNDGDLKKGQKYYHGVNGGYSVQAPNGMLRITQAEFGQMRLSSSTENLIKNYVKRSSRVSKIPSAAKMKRLRSLMKVKTRISSSEIDELERSL